MTFFEGETAKNITTGVYIKSANATFAAGATESSLVDVWGYTLSKIFVPQNFLGNNITFKVSNDEINFYPYRNMPGQNVSGVTMPESIIGLAPIDFFGVRYFKIVSDTAETNAPTIEVLLVSMK